MLTWCSWCDSGSFTDQETEAQRGEVICPNEKSRVWSVWSQSPWFSHYTSSSERFYVLTKNWPPFGEVQCPSDCGEEKGTHDKVLRSGLKRQKGSPCLLSTSAPKLTSPCVHLLHGCRAWCQEKGRSDTGHGFISLDPTAFRDLPGEGGLCCTTDPHVALLKVESMTYHMPHLGAFGRRYGNKGFHDQRAWEGTSLVVQWLRVCLPMQGTQVRSLVQEDPTCRGATKPVRHNY